MKATGIQRRVDELGRIVLPVELRRALEIEDRDLMEIYMDEHDCIVLKPHRDSCVFCGGTASDDLCRRVVLNTASVQLLPTTVASVRAGLGCGAPLDILPAVWVSSVLSVTAGLAAAGMLRRVWGDRS